MRYFYIILYLLFICSITTKGAKISGIITDEDGIGLGFSSIIVKGTSLGTSANADGFYTLNLPAGKYVLQAQSIGYKQSFIEIILTENVDLLQNFKLQGQGYELKDVVIKSTDEDPAYRIIRNAIQKRKFHLAQTQSFQTSIYLKGVLRNRSSPKKIIGIKLKDEDTIKGVVYLCEQVADYYASGNKNRLIIKSVKESGNPNGVGMGSVPPIINFYTNNVNVLVGDATFISPISDGAINAYTYKLLGNFEENNKTIYKIKVIPKHGFERCFAGDIYIADADWSIHSVQLLLTKKQGLDFLDTIRVEQQYINLAKEIWVIKNQVFYPTLSLLGFDFAGNFVTIYNNQKIGQPIPDSIFNKKVTVTYQRGATKKDSIYWQELRPMKLEDDELRNYNYGDSLYTILTDPKRVDSLRRKNNKITIADLLFNGVGFMNKSFKTKLSVTPIIADVNFNVVEGLNYSPSFYLSHKIDSNKFLNLSTNFRYGFSNTHFNAKGLIRYTSTDKWLKGKFWSAGFAGGKYISQLNQDQPVNEFYNTFSSLVQQRNYFKIYERYFTAIQFKQQYGNGLKWIVSAQYENRQPLQNTESFSFVQKTNKDPYTTNTPSEFTQQPLINHYAFTFIANIYFQPGVTYTQYPDHKEMHSGEAPIFSLCYQKGIPGILKSSTDFDKWHFKVTDEINLKRWGSFEYNAKIGGFLSNKNVQIPDMTHLMGNQYLLASSYLNSFQLASYYRFSNTAKLYGELHVEYFMKGLLTNKLPLLRQAHWYFVLGSNTFYSQQNNYYTEAFIGIDNLGFKIFRIFRFDYVRGWDNNKTTYSGFRLGLKMGSVGRINKYENEALIF